MQLTRDGLEEDEDLGLQFNKFVIDTRKIPLKFEHQFKKMSKFILEKVSQDKLKDFVKEYKEILEAGSDQTFCSIIEMVDHFHAVVQNSQVYNFLLFFYKKYILVIRLFKFS